MICPGWQYPHWGTFSLIQACCTGWLPSGESPSIVMTSFPLTDETGVTQDRVAFAVHVNRTGAAKRFSTTEFCAGQTEVFPEHPQERGVRRRIDLKGFSVYFDGNHGSSFIRNYTILVFLMGSRRIRLPVMLNKALQIAGAMGGTPGSPTPVDKRSLDTMCTCVSKGASSILATG